MNSHIWQEKATSTVRPQLPIASRREVECWVWTLSAQKQAIKTVQQMLLYHYYQLLSITNSVYSWFCYRLVFCSQHYYSLNNKAKVQISTIVPDPSVDIPSIFHCKCTQAIHWMQHKPACSRIGNPTTLSQSWNVHATECFHMLTVTNIVGNSVILLTFCSTFTVKWQWSLELWCRFQRPVQLLLQSKLFCKSVFHTCSIFLDSLFCLSQCILMVMVLASRLH